MASTYTPNNGIELIADGEQEETWGDTTNDNFSFVDTSLDGQVSVMLIAPGSSGAPNALAISDGAASDGRNRAVTFVDDRDLGVTAFVQLTPNDAEKIMLITNSLSGGQAINLFQGTYSASNDYTIENGETAWVRFDGGGAGAVVTRMMSDVGTPSDISITGGSIDGTPIGATSASTGAFTTVTTTGDVGVGEASPSARLHVTGGSPSNPLPIISGNTHLLIQSAGVTAMSIMCGNNTGLSALNFGDIDDENVGMVYYDHTNNELNFRTVAIDRMLIDSAGRVGIGNDNPSAADATGDNLVVGTTSGDNGITIFSGPSAQGKLLFGDGSGTSSFAGYLVYDNTQDSMRFGIDAVERARFNSDGDFGLGTNDPQAKVHATVASTDNRIIGLSDPDFGIRMGTDLDGAIIDAVDNTLNTTYENLKIRASAMQFAIGGTERARLTNAGDFLYGVITAQGGLENTNDGVTIYNSGAIVSARTGGDTNLFLNQIGASSTDVIQIGRNGVDEGNVAVGSGGIAVNGRTFLGFQTADTERMRITLSRIGMFLTNPYGTLHVRTGDSGTTSYNTAADDFIVESTSNVGMTLASPSTTVGNIVWANETDDAAAYIAYRHPNDRMEFAVSSGEKMRLTDAGDLLINKTAIGVATQGIELNGSDYLAVTRPSNITAFFNRQTDDGDVIVVRQDNANEGSIGTAGSMMYVNGDSKLGFYTGDTERARFDSSGFCTFGSTTAITSNENTNVGASILSGASAGAITTARTATTANIFLSKVGAVDGEVARFSRNALEVGSITVSAGATAYNTSSDYRMKENISALTGAADLVMALKPSRFNFIGEEQTIDGFLAHEAQEVVPNAVTGEKDGEDMQSIDHSKLVPLLTAALQDALRRIEHLESEAEHA